MGGFGDLVMMTALFPEIKKRGFKLRVVVSDHYGDILEGHPMIDHYVRLPEEKFWELRGSFDAMHSIDLKYPDWWGEAGGRFKLTTHIIRLWIVQAGLLSKPGMRMPNPTLPTSMIPMNLFEATCRYVTIQTKTGWSPYKDWPLSYWEKLTHMIQDRYRDVIVIQVGGSNDPEVPGSVKHRGRTILNAVAEVANSDLFIGPDSVFQHVAKATGTKAIVIWGSTNPEGFGYDSHVNMVAGLKCQPCYREYNHIEAGNGCPTTYDSSPMCQSVVTPEQVFEQVKLILGEPT